MTTLAHDRLILGEYVRPADGRLRLERYSGPYTRAEVDAAADEGSEWWECEDGVITVTATPSARHQAMVTGFMRAWLAVLPAEGGLIVMPGPQRVVVSETTWVEPDLAIWNRDPDIAAGTTGVPLLVVEISSPSTARADRTGKRLTYARAGVEWYVRADYRAPELEVEHLEAGTYHLHARVEGDEAVTCPVTGIGLVPSSLARG
jgi:Uma2 family endonuclease